MTLRARRDFLKGGGLAVGVLATQACSSTGSVPTVLAATAAPPTATVLGNGTQVASFGWEVCNLGGNGANTYVKVANNMIVQTVNVDLAASIMSNRAAGFAEILCTGGVSRQALPSFDSSSQAYINFPASPDFGAVTPENPHGLSLLASGMVQDQFLAVILKTWISPDGSGSATSRQVLVYPSLNVSAGDYLVFHMDHQGVSVDAEMQIVITYTLT
jgi:hypothetical protein